MFRYIILCWLILAGCAGSSTQFSPPKTQRNYHNFLSEYISCTGNGKINSRGPIKGALTFTFMSQHDSSFFQFKDPLGRKALLMWLTPQNVAAWNLIENIQMSFKKNDLAHESKVLVSATFLDQTSNQSVEIQIKNRTRTQKILNMKRTWKLLKI